MACRTLELFGSDCSCVGLNSRASRRQWDITPISERTVPGRRSRADARTSRAAGVTGVLPRQRTSVTARDIERFVMTVATAVALLAGCAGAVRLLADSQGQSAPKTVSVLIAPGDDLWSIAQKYTAPGQSTSALLNEIRAANPELSQGDPISVGERIAVPIDSNR